MTYTTTATIKEKMAQAGYSTNQLINTALSAALNTGTPLLIEGAPGSGKTSMAKAVAEAFGLPFIRVQFYDGLTADKILYDYNYQRQLLTIESIKPTLESELQGKDITEAMEVASHIDFYGEDFLIERPILKTLRSDQQVVLLLDEVDKASEELEYTLLEFLDEFSMTIPQYGTIAAKHKPIVFLTSNRYRELSDALKRRCNYIFLKSKTAEEMAEIITAQAQVNPTVAAAVADVVAASRNLNLTQTPSIAEAVGWAKFIKEAIDHGDSDMLSDLGGSLGHIAKAEGDADRISKSGKAKEALKAVSDAAMEAVWHCPKKREAELEAEIARLGIDFMKAVGRLRADTDKYIPLIGESPLDDWELGFRVHPKVAELPEYAPLIAAKNELTALQYPHIAKYLTPENEMGLTADEIFELRRLGNIASNASWGMGAKRTDLAPELRSPVWTPSDQDNPFFDRLKYEYRLAASGGLVALPDSVSNPEQIKLATPWGVLTPMDKLQGDDGRVDLSSALWTDEERRIAYRFYPWPALPSSAPTS